MSGRFVVILLVTSASCCRSFMLTPFFLAPAVAPFVMLFNEFTNAPRALITQSAWLIAGRVMLLCWNSTVSDRRLVLVSLIKLLCCCNQNCHRDVRRLIHLVSHLIGATD